jgi:hypothetical protein
MYDARRLGHQSPVTETVTLKELAKQPCVI